MQSAIQSSVSWAENDYWMSWNKQNEEIDWGQEEKPERKVQELWSIRERIWHPARLTVKGWEHWLPILHKYLKVFSLHQIQRFQAWWNLYCYLGCGYHLKHMEWWLCWRASQMWCAPYISSPLSAKHTLNTRMTAGSCDDELESKSKERKKAEKEPYRLIRQLTPCALVNGRQRWMLKVSFVTSNVHHHAKAIFEL